MSEHTMADMRELFVLRWGHREGGERFDAALAAHDAEVLEKARAEGIVGFSMEEICAKLGGSEADIRADERASCVTAILDATSLTCMVKAQDYADGVGDAIAAICKDGSHE